jgi:hypothetical protein
MHLVKREGQAMGSATVNRTAMARGLVGASGVRTTGATVIAFWPNWTVMAAGAARPAQTSPSGCWR